MHDLIGDQARSENKKPVLKSRYPFNQRRKHNPNFIIRC